MSHLGMFFIVTTWLHTVKLDAKEIIALRIDSFAPLHRLRNYANAACLGADPGADRPDLDDDPTAGEPLSSDSCATLLGHSSGS